MELQWSLSATYQHFATASVCLILLHQSLLTTQKFGGRDFSAYGESLKSHSCESASPPAPVQIGLSVKLMMITIINTRTTFKVVVKISPDAEQVTRLQSAESTQSLSSLCLARAKSRFSEMLIGLRRRMPSKSAVSSKMILVSLGHDDLSP